MPEARPVAVIGRYALHDEIASGAGAAGAGASGAGGGGAGGAAGCTPTGTVEYCDAVDNDCNPATQDVCPASCVGYLFAGESYMVCGGDPTYAAAEALCEAQKMRLVKIDNAAENKFVLTLITPATLYAWIGGTDSAKAKTFKWPDGTTLWTGGAAVAGVYTNFGSGEPDTLSVPACLQMTRGPAPPAGEWTDTPCTEKQPFVCERY